LPPARGPGAQIRWLGFDEVSEALLLGFMVLDQGTRDNVVEFTVLNRGDRSNDLNRAQPRFVAQNDLRGADGRALQT
jgi:hypothetical protein